MYLGFDEALSAETFGVWMGTEVYEAWLSRTGVLTSSGVAMDERGEDEAVDDWRTISEAVRGGEEPSGDGLAGEALELAVRLCPLLVEGGKAACSVRVAATLGGRFEGMF